jgi:hypothetical protein
VYILSELPAVRWLCILGGIKKMRAKISMKSVPAEVRTRIVVTAGRSHLTTGPYLVFLIFQE